MTLVMLNGGRQELPDGATVEAAVTATGAPADGRGVAVALDGEVVPRGQWSTTPFAKASRSRCCTPCRRS